MPHRVQRPIPPRASAGFPDCSEPQSALMLRPSGVSLIDVTVQPSDRKSWGASLLAAPFAQSRTIFMPERCAPGTRTCEAPPDNLRRAPRRLQGPAGDGSRRQAWRRSAREYNSRSSPPRHLETFMPDDEISFTPLSSVRDCEKRKLPRPRQTLRDSTSQATPGVVSTPAETGSAPPDASPWRCAP